MTRGRLVMLACLSLVLGAGVNTVIAWWLASRPWSQALAQTTRDTFIMPNGWFSIVARGRGRVHIRSTYLIAWNEGQLPWRPPPWCIASETPSAEHLLDQWTTGVAMIEWVDVGAGWPLRSLAYREKRASQSRLTEPTVKVTVVDAREVLLDGERFVLPLRPILPGLVINTLLYAFAAFLLLIAVGSARAALVRQLRRRRGLCPACGYDLSGRPAGSCPECGGSAAGVRRPSPALMDRKRPERVHASTRQQLTSAPRRAGPPATGREAT